MPVDWKEVEEEHEQARRRLDEQERATRELAQRVHRLEETAKVFRLRLEEAKERDARDHPG